MSISAGWSGPGLCSGTTLPALGQNHIRDKPATVPNIPLVRRHRVPPGGALRSMRRFEVGL